MPETVQLFKNVYYQQFAPKHTKFLRIHCCTEDQQCTQVYATSNKQTHTDTHHITS